MKFAEACAVFHTRPEEVTWPEVRVRYRALARAAHPDLHGGARAAWDRLQAAYLRLKEELARPRPCPAGCERGQLKTMQRGRVVAHPCPRCGGQGVVNPE